MAITVELTYDMGKELGCRSFELEGVSTVADVLRAARERFGEKAASFDGLSSRAAVAVNGVLTSHRRGRRTRLADGDVVTFVKAAAGG